MFVNATGVVYVVCPRTFDDCKLTSMNKIRKKYISIYYYIPSSKPNFNIRQNNYQ